MDIKILSGTMETPLVVDRVVRGYEGGKRSSKEDEEAAASSKMAERRRVSTDGKSMRLKEVAFGGTADEERGDGNGCLQHITDQGGCVGNVV